ncbi:hypothetical protein GCM10023349_06390 [Nocardioides conyzicola]|uniref:DUF4175 domain-containing protein n=1 Tax=Nocardioides conyzicola TaxID=1651781 RepID=A0ABP8WU18_9ACTN
MASEVYAAHAGGRSPVMDGPLWIGVAVAASLAVFVFVGGPLKWLALPLLLALVVLPLSVRWALAGVRSVAAFREGLRD